MLQEPSVIYLNLFEVNFCEGSLSAPYVVDYSQNFGLPAMLLLGILVAIQSIICICLKETFLCERQEQIEELQSRRNSLVTKEV